MSDAALMKPGDVVVGMDIGGTKMMAVVYDHAFNKMGTFRKKNRDARGSTESFVVDIIRGALAKAGDPVIVGIGVGSPGPLNPDTGVIIDTPNLGWKNFPLGQMLNDTFGVPVVVDNDVNVGTYGEWCFTDLRSCRHLLGIFPGTGIGGGIIIDGKLLHGFSGAAGEIGHMTMMLDGPYCGCGKRGCLESLASRLAIAKEVATMAARGDAPTILEKCGTDLGAIRSGALARAVQAGEVQAESEIRKAAYYIGVGAANLINVLSPEAVVFGGGLVEAMETLIMEEVRRAVKEHAMPFIRKGVKLSPAQLGDYAVVLGAAQLIAERIAAES